MIMLIYMIMLVLMIMLIKTIVGIRMINLIVMIMSITMLKVIKINISHLLTADSPPPYVSLTMKYPFFTTSESSLHNFEF